MAGSPSLPAHETVLCSASQAEWVRLQRHEAGTYGAKWCLQGDALQQAMAHRELAAPAVVGPSSGLHGYTEELGPVWARCTTLA